MSEDILLRPALSERSVAQLSASRRQSKSRFFRKVELIPWTGCWIWMGCTSNGYGHMRRDKRCVLAHRFSFELHKGPIPEGLDLDHLCRTPCCVNPDHLEPVTTVENTLRGRLSEVTRSRYARIKSCPKGHEYSVENTAIYRQQNQKYTRRACRECLRERARLQWQQRALKHDRIC